MTHRVLVVDDEGTIRESLADALSDEGLVVQLAPDGRAALAMIAREVPDVVLADVRMPELDGLGLLRAIRTGAHDIDVVLMTAFDDMPTVAAAMREGAADFLTKPLDLHELRRVLRRSSTIGRRAPRGGSRAAGGDGPRAEQLVGRDAKMIEIYKVVGQVAASRTNVLIRGESGTGKELDRAGDSRAVERGVGAVRRRQLLRPAAGAAGVRAVRPHPRRLHGCGDRPPRPVRPRRAGHDLLDEIGDTSADFQTKLLRVLQQQEFDPVGAERPERTEARVIAATHRNLEDMIARSLFREDLYYRLRVVELTVPPLRERHGDLPLLVEHLVTRASTALGRPQPVLSPEAFAAIRHHRWPGNVRELENCLRRAVVLATGDVIRPEHLGIGAIASDSPAHLPSLAELEREHVARVMTATHGHKARAAQILGVSRPRLNRLLQQDGLE